MGLKLSGADNVPLQIRRRVFNEIQINEQGVRVKLDFEPGIIANLPEVVDFILGLDVLRRAPYLIDPVNLCLIPRSDVQLHSAEAIETPPKSGYLRCVTSPRKRNHHCGYIAEGHTNEIELQRSLLTVRDGQTVVAVMNISPQTVTTSIGQPVGYKTAPDLKPTLQNIQIGPSRTPTQTEQLCSLLRDYRNCFQTDRLGQCAYFCHRIKTNAAHPIATPPYRQSQNKRQQTQQLVDEFLEQGLV